MNQTMTPIDENYKYENAPSKENEKSEYIEGYLIGKMVGRKEGYKEGIMRVKMMLEKILTDRG